jgi:hypothetical protein
VNRILIENRCLEADVGPVNVTRIVIRIPWKRAGLYDEVLVEAELRGLDEN